MPSSSCTTFTSGHFFLLVPEQSMELGGPPDSDRSLAKESRREEAPLYRASLSSLSPRLARRASRLRCVEARSLDYFARAPSLFRSLAKKRGGMPRDRTRWKVLFSAPFLSPTNTNTRRRARRRVFLTR